MSGTPLRTVLHGDHELDRSRAEQTYLTAAQQEGADITTLDFSKLTTDELSEIVGTTSLFGGDRLLRIYNFEKVRSSKTLKEFLALLEESSDGVLIVIQGKMTPAKKKLFSRDWKQQEFKLPAVLFEFLESIKTRPIHHCFSLYRQALESGSEWGLHALLARQFRLLLSTKTGAPVQAPPFAKGKLKQQADRFTLAEITQSLHTLYDIEKQIKSGSTPLTWSQHFDTLLTKLYQ